MVNDGSRRSHGSKDEPRGKPEWVGVYVSEHLSFTYLGKASWGEPRPKPESGNPTFRDCRGARGNVTLSLMTQCARLGSIPTRPDHSTKKSLFIISSMAEGNCRPLRHPPGSIQARRTKHSTSSRSGAFCARSRRWGSVRSLWCGFVAQRPTGRLN